MHLYIAGLYASSFHLTGNQFRQCSPAAQGHRLGVKHLLESYHYVYKGSYAERIRKDGGKVFLDSGAFSAFSLGVDINIEAYAEFIKGNQDIIEMASVLDAIGDAEGTYHNQNRLEALGAAVLPCFHYGEPLDLCEYYVKNYKYMTIGGMVPIPNNKLEVWLDEIWSKVLTDKDGYARTKVHGFGLTARSLMAKYPWYSVDSSSWVQMGANGNLVLPELERPIAMSERSPRTKDFARHYATFDPVTKATVDSLLAKYGSSAAEVSTGYRERWMLNAFSFHCLGDMLGPDHWKKPFKAAAQGLF